MRTRRDLQSMLDRIDRRGYPAYKDLRGGYDMGAFELHVDHVQGDPFAAPSSLSVFVPHDRARFPKDLFDSDHRKLALEDQLVRRFGSLLAKHSFRVGGSGKSGLLATSRPGPEVIKRTACDIGPKGVTLRFEAGFPAHGRTVDAQSLARMLLEYVPRCVEGGLVFDSLPASSLYSSAHLADDQHFIRSELERLNLVSFVADGSMLARESGVSSRPMRDAVPFVSPESLRVVLDLPHRGPTTGMGIERGVTLIVGGGYHGKTTLLEALQAGVYNHVPGDGRELVITRDDAVKLRAEDGRPVHSVDVSSFIGLVPSGVDTAAFCTRDASGSTSQAASLVEAVESGSRALLMDEDTSATNFMVRDALMEQVVQRTSEPITPFAEQARNLFEQLGVSSVLVAGSSGAFFFVADTVIQMDRYEARDVTPLAKEVCALHPKAQVARAARLGFSDNDRFVAGGGATRHDARSDAGGKQRGDGRGRGGRPGSHDRVKAHVHGSLVEAGNAAADLVAVEQIVDPEQKETLAQALRWAVERDLFSTCTVGEIADVILDEVHESGLASIDSVPYASCGMAFVRKQELVACLNRVRFERRGR